MFKKIYSKKKMCSNLSTLKISKKKKQEENIMKKNLTTKNFLEIMFMEGELWISTIYLKELSGRDYKNIRRDFIVEIEHLLEEALENGIIDDMKYNLLYSKLNDFVNGRREDFFISDFTDGVSIKRDVLGTINVIKIKKVYTKDKMNRIFTVYLFNKSTALLLISKYSPLIRMTIINIFFKTEELLKSKGYKINSIEDMHTALDEEIKDRIETLESDVFEENEELD